MDGTVHPCTDLAREYNTITLKQSPKNVFYYRTTSRNEYYFYQISKSEVDYKASLKALRDARRLAPTDPRYPYFQSLFALGLSLIHISIAKKTLEERFIHLLDGVKLDSPLIKLTQAILLEAWNDEKSLDLSLIMQSEKEKLARDIQIANLSKRISVTEDENLISHYEDQLKGLLDLNQAHKDKCLIKKESYTEEEFRTASEMVFKTLENPVRMWKKPKYIDRSTLIRMHFAEPLRYDVKEGFRTPTLEPAIEIIGSLESTNSPSVDSRGVEPLTSAMRMQRSTN